MAEKSQDVRLLDVFVFGPFWIAAAKHMPTRGLQTAMLVSGIATIAYNGLNYLDDQEPIEWWRDLKAETPFL